MSDPTTTRWPHLSRRWVVGITLAATWFLLNWYFNTSWWNDIVNFIVQLTGKIVADLR